MADPAALHRGPWPRRSSWIEVRKLRFADGLHGRGRSSHMRPCGLAEVRGPISASARPVDLERRESHSHEAPDVAAVAGLGTTGELGSDCAGEIGQIQRRGERQWSARSFNEPETPRRPARRTRGQIASAGPLRSGASRSSRSPAARRRRSAAAGGPVLAGPMTVPCRRRTPPTTRMGEQGLGMRPGVPRPVDAAAARSDSSSSPMGPPAPATPCWPPAHDAGTRRDRAGSLQRGPDARADAFASISMGRPYAPPLVLDVDTGIDKTASRFLYATASDDGELLAGDVRERQRRRGPGAAQHKGGGSAGAGRASEVAVGQPSPLAGALEPTPDVRRASAGEVLSGRRRERPLVM